MKVKSVDILIIGAGPVGLMCAYLARLCGMRVTIIDKSSGPLSVGRADALNARSLQLLEVINVFSELYPLGKTCNTSSVWKDGRFTSRQSSWWESLEGCFHKHFLMLGQAHVEKLLNNKLASIGAMVKRNTSVINIELDDTGCVTTLSNGKKIRSRYIVGADGSRSFVREYFSIPFNTVRPQIVWAVIDAIIETDFPKVPEIIVFQSETSDVAWIPREEPIDRFYVRMDQADFKLEDAIYKINVAMKPHYLKINELVWFSQFSVKESVAENYAVKNRVFLAGDACHIHSVNGGQGLNTGLADAFNLIWKLYMVMNHHISDKLLDTYESERKPVALSVIKSSGELVRSTKYSVSGTHAEDYVKIIEKRAGNITGMGIRYGKDGLCGERLHDFAVVIDGIPSRIYSQLCYQKMTLMIFSDIELNLDLPEYIKLIQVSRDKSTLAYWSTFEKYMNMAILVRPDAYIQAACQISDISSLLADCFTSFVEGSIYE